MTTEKLIKAIKDYERHALPISKNVFTGDNITAELIEKHCNRYGINCQGEQPILIVNDSIVDSFGGYGWTGLMITNKTLYYKCTKDSFLSGLVALSSKGIIPLEQVHTIAIGHHDTCFGTAYVGHQLVINNEIMGLLRMGGGIEFDDKAISQLTHIFKVTR
ncbi:hypothetical protein [Prevotella jejuni]|uniref:hypothetical protein n=1 Tax=Prevotella jejuni TaxID=1177574 RepID=UPI0028DC88B9|nr:hypothetical protein [Prevotella jejuni]